MTRPYSGNLRFRVASAVLNGQTCRQAAAVFGVSVSCAATWSKRMRETGSAAAKPMGGARRDALCKAVAKQATGSPALC
jgi:transposase